MHAIKLHHSSIRSNKQREIAPRCDNESWLRVLGTLKKVAALLRFDLAYPGRRFEVSDPARRHAADFATVGRPGNWRAPW